jgi:putative ABC transport system ATP-binding protein
MNAHQPALRVSGLSKSFRTADGRGTLAVLHPTSFEVAAGTSLAIVGPSGSGKTTLLGLCAGLDAPTAGSIELVGIALQTLDEDARAQVRSRHVGFVFQNFQLIPTLTALENVMVPLELRGEATRTARAAAQELLQRVGLAERMQHYPTQLSGGEQQRVALARGFVTKPSVLFADEPTGNLDGDNSTRIAELLFALNRDSGTTLILSTHDVELAARTQRILRLKNGSVVSDEPAPQPAVASR